MRLLFWLKIWWCPYVKDREKSLFLKALPSKSSKNNDYSSFFKKIGLLLKDQGIVKINGRIANPL